jgi:formylglycine-generating enzyme required for sulfatase activity
MTDLLLPAFLSYLRGQGFNIGIDHYLRLQELLVKIGPHCPPGDVKYLLCPLFATGEKQQRQFYHAFDSFFKPLQAQKEKEISRRHPGKPGRETREEPVKPRRWQYVLSAVLLLILAALIFYRLGDRPVEKFFSPAKETTAAAQPRVPGQDQEPGPGQETKETRVKTIRTYQPSFLEKYGYIVHGTAVLAPWIIFLLVEVYRYHRRRLVLIKKRGKKPPYVWPIRVETLGLGLVKSETFYRSARLLRRRMQSDTRVLDIDKTVAASIELAGFPVLRHKVLTRPPEYLMLIDLPAYRDHYSQLFDTIARALEKEGLYVTRYFYEKDPRVCFKEPGQSRVYLAQLQARYSDSRLIICGDGAGLLDPATGDLDSWTGLFRAWQERAILTPLPPGEWRMREIALAGEFILLPASIRGLGALVEYFQAPDCTGAKVFTREERQTPFLTPGSENDIAALREYLGKDAFQWLCACAVWPGLHWDLTLYLGALPCMPGNLISEENLLRLLRLPWFRTGVMPEELRWEMMTALDKEINKAIRTALIDLLENNPAPEESAAYDDYRLNVAVQRWLLSRLDRKKRRERLKSLKEFNAMHIEQDYTLVRFLESTPGSPLQMVLPQRLRKIFYKKGVPFFGIKTVFRVALTFLAAAAAFLFLKPANMDMPLEVRYIKSLGITVSQNEKKCWEADYGDGIKMVYIEPGEFKMGQTIEEKKRLIEQVGEKDYNLFYKDETPEHPVYLDGYWIGKTEVTVRQYLKFVSETKSHYPEWLEKGNEYNINTGSNDYYKKFVSDENCPIVGVSWENAKAYCDWLSNKTGLNFTLPTEAQWEKAARGTDQRKYPWGDSPPSGKKVNFADKQLSLKGKYGWEDKNIDDGYAYTAPVGSYPEGASPYGMLDMAGNVWEWCNDWYGPYKPGYQRNPVGPSGGTTRVLRGGCWTYNAVHLRCSDRNVGRPSFRDSYAGFRLCQDN